MTVEKAELPVWALKVRALRKRLGLSQQELADRVKTSQSGVAKWERGAHSPSPESYMLLADLAKGDPDSLFFMEKGGVPTAFFMGKKGQEGLVPALIAEHEVRKAESRRGAELVAGGYLSENTRSVRHIPLLKDASAAGSARAVDENEIEELIALPKKWVGGPGGELYLVKVEGDSMSPILESGYMVLVDVSVRDPKVLENSMVLARIGDGVTIKWLNRDGDLYMLVPQNKSLRHPVQIIRPGGDISLVGQVKWLMGQLPQAKRK